MIAVHEARGPEWCTFDGTLAEFPVAVLSGETQAPLFPDTLLSSGAYFTASPALQTGQIPTTATPPAGRTMNSATNQARAR